MADILPDFVPLNEDLLFNPVNWLIIVLMVMLGTILITMITGAFLVSRNVSDATGN